MYIMIVVHLLRGGEQQNKTSQTLVLRYIQISVFVSLEKVNISINLIIVIIIFHR